MMNASYGIKGFFDYIPEPYSKYLPKEQPGKPLIQNKNPIKAAPGDMMFLLMMYMLLY